MPAFRKASRRWKPWKPPTSTREVEKDMELEAKRFQELAPRLGWCGACGVSVEEDAGKLHAADCPYLPQTRRRA